MAQRWGLLPVWGSLVLALAATVQAQDVQHLETGFLRDVSRYRWEAGFSMAQQWGPWAVQAENQFQSDAYQLFGNRLSFRDENHFAWAFGRTLNPRFALDVQGRTAAFSLSRVLNQSAYAGLRYRPTPAAWVMPQFGVAMDRRPGIATEDGTSPLRTDVGPAYGLQLGWTPPAMNGYEVRLAGEAAFQVINPRRGRAVRLQGQARRQFEGTQLGAEVLASSFRRDVYQAVSFLNRDVGAGRRSETIEATTSDTLAVSFSVVAPFYRHFRLDGQLDFSVNSRLIRTHRAPGETLFFDTDFNRRTVDLVVGVQYERPRLSARVGLRGGAEVERRALVNDDALPGPQAAQKSALLRQADYDRGHLMLMANTRFALAPPVVLTFDGSASILRHDTPDLNPDDRDEVYYNGLLGLLLRLSRYLELDVRVFGTYYHTVYLKARRSAENNVQRSLRLRPTVRWNPSPQTRISLGSEVRATYTVDDFLLPGRRPTDQSAREMRYDGTLEHDLGGGRRLLASGSLSDLRLGRFLNDVFSEIPFDTLRTSSGWFRLQVGQRAVTEVGLRFLVRRDFDRAASVRYSRRDAEGNVLRDDDGNVLRSTISRPGRTRIEQVGPTCAINWPMRGGKVLRLDGWLIVQHVRTRLYGDLPEASGDHIRRTGQRGVRTVIPNISLALRWNF